MGTEQKRKLLSVNLRRIFTKAHQATYTICDNIKHDNCVEDTIQVESNVQS